MLDIFKDSISHLWVRNEERERHHDHDSVRIADSTEIPGNPRIIQGLLRHCNECTWFCKRVPAGYRVGNDHRTAARGLKEIKHVSFYAFNVHLWSTLQCLTVSQSICWYCCDRGGCGAQIAILCLVRGVYLVCECQVLHEIEQHSSRSRDMAEFSSNWPVAPCTNLMMIVSFVASHFHQTTKTRNRSSLGKAPRSWTGCSLQISCYCSSASTRSGGLQDCEPSNQYII